MPIHKYSTNIFSYFKRIKTSITNDLLLDFGSNYGTFLESSNGQFPEQNYTGIDVDKEALDFGIKMFPKAKFIWYDAFNPVYNPNGFLTDFKFSHNFDTIISYSVLTHTSKEDMLAKIEWLYEYLNPGGTILATWLDVDCSAAVNFFYNRRIKDFGCCESIKTDDYIYLVDNKCSKVIEQNIKFLISFYKKEYITNLLTKYNITFYNSFPPSFQNCFMIEKPKYENLDTINKNG
jgi:hypothetical protein